MRSTFYTLAKSHCALCWWQVLGWLEPPKTDCPGLRISSCIPEAFSLVHETISHNPKTSSGVCKIFSCNHEGFLTICETVLIDIRTHLQACKTWRIILKRSLISPWQPCTSYFPSVASFHIRLCTGPEGLYTQPTQRLEWLKCLTGIQ